MLVLVEIKIDANIAQIEPARPPLKMLAQGESQILHSLIVVAGLTRHRVGQPPDVLVPCIARFFRREVFFDAEEFVSDRRMHR
jgi:hypothetical protein